MNQGVQKKTLSKYGTQNERRADATAEHLCVVTPLFWCNPYSDTNAISINRKERIHMTLPIFAFIRFFRLKCLKLLSASAVAIENIGSDLPELCLPHQERLKKEGYNRYCDQ
jgi:hypothetical protein